MRKVLVSIMSAAFAFFLVTSIQTIAADAAAPAPAAKAGEMVANPATPAAPAAGQASSGGGGPGFLTIILSGGFIGILIWLMLFGSLAALIYFWTDCALMISIKRVMPTTLVEKVTQAMEEGDVFKALKHCEEEPGPLANVLSAGFSNVDQGFETIQDMISAAAQMESEKLTARTSWLNLVANVAPLLGLLGTVQGMIFAFAAMATTTAGAAQQAMLALNIAQALYTTLAGMMVSIPALMGFNYYKNVAAKIVLGMEALTMDLVKSLRNVEVVAEE
ncbi:MAG: hypothetical protein A2283_21645 [Lentisphaerae bacterium RIFOXYA12_FULL_48_11]|nr:MAG: hypothetical protein A2283_21645 [Lentisphaerae bacterium RIFOXYA12_FULL_48_11]